MTSAVFGALAERLFRNGYSPIPVTPGTKKCMETGWSTLTTGNEENLKRWCRVNPQHSIGIVCGNVVGIDVDVYDPIIAEICAQKVAEFSNDQTLVRFGQRPKRLFLFRCSHEHFSKLMTPEFRIGKFERNKIEILAKGQMFVGFGMHPDTGRPYEWPHKSPIDTKLSDLPPISENEATVLRGELSMLIEELGGQNIGRHSKSSSTESSHRPQNPSKEEITEIAKALTFIDSQNREFWIAVGHALKLDLGEEGLEIYQQWSKTRTDGSKPINYRGEVDVARAWASFKPSRTSLSAIWRRAEAAGYVCADAKTDDSMELQSDSIKSMVEQLNQEWFVVLETGKVFVCRERINPNTGHEQLEFFFATGIS